MTKKTLGYVVVAAIVAIGLSGCFRFTSEYTLHDDNTVSGVIVLAFEEEFADQDITQLTGGLDPSDQFGNITASDYNQDGYVGKRYEFSGESIDKLSAGNEDLSITRDGDTFVVDGSLGSADEFIPGGEAWVSITFPGEVTEHNGTLAGTTVTWNASEGQFDVHAVGGATGGGGGAGIPVVVWAILGLLVVVGAGAFLVLQDRRSKAGGAEAA